MLSAAWSPRRSPSLSVYVLLILYRVISSVAELCAVCHVYRNDAAQAKRNGRAHDPVLSVVASGELAVDGNDGALMNTPRATAGA